MWDLCRECDDVKNLNERRITQEADDTGPSFSTATAALSPGLMLSAAVAFLLSKMTCSVLDQPCSYTKLKWIKLLRYTLQFRGCFVHSILMFWWDEQGTDWGWYLMQCRRGQCQRNLLPTGGPAAGCCHTLSGRLASLDPAWSSCSASVAGIPGTTGEQGGHCLHRRLWFLQNKKEKWVGGWGVLWEHVSLTTALEDKWSNKSSANQSRCHLCRPNMRHEWRR